MWRPLVNLEVRDPRGTIAERYLAEERGLRDVIDDVLALTLRFHPSCPFRDGEERVRAPALICALRDPSAAIHACSNFRDEMDVIERRFLRDPANVLAIQRIRLTEDGKKVGRFSFGPMENGAVFLSSIWESFYSGQATIGEGVETMLAMRFGFQGCIAVCGASRFASFQPPWQFAELILSGEHDDGPSESAWRAAGPRWASEGHHVRVWVPPAADGAGKPLIDARGRCPPKDANDLLFVLARKAATP